MSRTTRLLALGPLLACTSAARCSDPQPFGGNWRLVWEDDFDGPAGQPPDPTYWGYDVGGGGWGNQQLEYDTDRPENVSLDGRGNLAITARAEPYLGRSYTSARINTRDKVEHGPGRFEARIRLPVGRGIWPAFWLLGADFGQVGWPTCGEIDVMEYRGQEPAIAHGSLHGPGYSGGSAVTARFELPGGARFDDDFHLFAVSWDRERIAWEIDGIVHQVVTPDEVPGRWVFDHPFFVILNVAVGGTFVGAPDATTQFPQTMLVDFVRVYERAP